MCYIHNRYQPPSRAVMSNQHSPLRELPDSEIKMQAKDNFPFPAFDLRYNEEQAHQRKDNFLSLKPSVPMPSSAIHPWTPKPEEPSSRDNIILTPVLKTPKEIPAILIEAASKRGRSPEEAASSSAKQRLSSSPLREISKPASEFSITGQTILLSSNNEVIISKENNTVMNTETETETPANEAIAYQEKLTNEAIEEATRSEDADISEDIILMNKIAKAVKSEVEPLRKQIGDLTNIIKLLIDNKNQPPTKIILSQQDNQSSGLLEARRDWGLAGQGRKQSLQHRSFASATAENLPNQNLSSRVNAKNVKINQPSAIPKPEVPINPAFSLAKRCQGFYPITSKDIKYYRDSYPEITDPTERFQKLGKDCIRDFLFKELKMSETVARDIRIKSVFYPTSGIATGILYAEFQSEGELDIIKQNAKFLKTTDGCRAKILSYIPKSLFNRHRAVEEKAFQIRSNDRTMATRVWINKDFELRKRKKGDLTPWSRITPEILLNLPQQDPKVPRVAGDTMDSRTPQTPMWGLQPNNGSNFESVNNFNFLMEEECI